MQERKALRQEVQQLLAHFRSPSISGFWDNERSVTDYFRAKTKGICSPTNTILYMPDISDNTLRALNNLHSGSRHLMERAYWLKAIQDYDPLTGYVDEEMEKYLERKVSPDYSVERVTAEIQLEEL